MFDFNAKNWCYWINETKPGTDKGTFEVGVVVEDEPGYYPTGGGEKDPLKAPWYWDRETCKRANAERGITEERAFEIVSSSMFAHKSR
jgi:hypothetical protein